MFTRYSQLKKRIEELEKLLEASNKKIALLEETLSTIDKYKSSKELGKYIERQQKAIKAAELLCSISNESLDISSQKAALIDMQKRQEDLNTEISSVIHIPKSDVVQEKNTSVKYLQYTSYGNEVVITGCTAFDPVDIVIPETIGGKEVTQVAFAAFKNSPIKTIRFSNRIREIGQNAFEGCINLIEVYNLNCKVNKFAFYRCEQLRKVEFGQNIEIIDSCAFFQCSQLSKVDLGMTKLTELSVECFKDSGLQSIIFPKTLRTVETKALGSSALQRILVPKYVEKVSCNFIHSSYNYRQKEVAFAGMNTIIFDQQYCNDNSLYDCTVYCLQNSQVQRYCRMHNISCRPLSEFSTDERST